MAQYSRPDADIAGGSWTKSTGTTYYGCIDETSYSDTDYIYENIALRTFCTVSTAPATDPNVHTGHKVIWRARAGTASNTGSVYLYSGVTAIATFTQALTTGYTTYTHTLSEAQAANITDYSDLRLSFYKWSGSGFAMYVSWAYVELPDVTEQGAGFSTAATSVADALLTATVPLAGGSTAASGSTLASITATVPIAGGSTAVSGSSLNSLSATVPIAGDSTAASGSDLNILIATFAASGGSTAASGSELDNLDIIVPLAGGSIAVSGSDLDKLTITVPIAGSCAAASGSDLDELTADVPIAGGSVAASGSELDELMAMVPIAGSCTAVSGSTLSVLSATLPETVTITATSNVTTTELTGYCYSSGSINPFLVIGSSQHGRPESGAVSGTWTIIGAATYQDAVNEAIPDDCDYVYTDVPPVPGGDLQVRIDFTLNEMQDRGIHENNIIRVRWITYTAATCTVSLYQGVTLIASWPGESPGDYEWVTSEFELTPAEAASITDFSALKVRVMVEELPT